MRPRFAFSGTGVTDRTDEQAKAPGAPDPKHPDAMNEEKFDDQGHHGFDNRGVGGRHERGNQVVHVTIARDEPVINVGAIECCLPVSDRPLVFGKSRLYGLVSYLRNVQ